MVETKTANYYEFLQISPNADSDTIHRVYRFLAARFHPDNQATGDAETFADLKAAYDVLADPERRAAYDADCEGEASAKTPLSAAVDFLDSLEGELNRRLAVLAVLYFRRRTNPRTPEVSLSEIEMRMGFPRDYLDFTTWYLLKKCYITRADNSDFTLTVAGVDFIETQRANIPVLNRLLTSGSDRSAADMAAAKKPSQHTSDIPMIVLPDMTVIRDRRRSSRDRRFDSLDRRPDTRATDSTVAHSICTN
jgi:curved DNA-binding protein